MIEFETKVKKWGNAMGVIIPKKSTKERISINDEVKVMIIQKEKETAATALWDSKLKLKRTSDELEEWVDKEFEKE